MIGSRLGRAALAAVALAASPAHGQPVPAAEGCVLHVWPSPGLKAQRQHALGNDPRGLPGLLPMLLDRSTRANNDKGDVRANDNLTKTAPPMSPATQIALLSSLALLQLLQLPASRVVFHDEPLDSRTIRTVKSRYADTPAPCYADLVTADVVYSREYAHRQNLKTFFRFRDFGADSVARATFATWVETDLHVFSIDPPNVGAEALGDLAAAFKNNVAIFTTMLARNRNPGTRDQRQ